ncbi:hypothetical protein [Streptomyces katrae]|nr:hypothetical protein [Streptomyces katrae]
MKIDETWTCEYDTSHQGRVRVLLAHGTTPTPVCFGAASDSYGRDVRH